MKTSSGFEDNFDGDFLTGKNVNCRFDFAEGSKPHGFPQPVVEFSAHSSAALPSHNVATPAAFPSSHCSCLLDPFPGFEHALGFPFLPVL
jgi:hypothetical protein